ncbi:hypothetical protein FSP39_018941 [Pinctada imbricata]|uniref:Uncharacterized protein n=1 Tax=Pinctada imbricata TaxID=66713 RepID=A0AA89C5N3_PINIB|nr:hypothetical protein FSP39_018941 [Pinctada imbricata]
MLRDLVENHVKQCGRSLFIFDEVDKMPPGLLDVVNPYLENYEQLNGVDYRKAIFIFISNVGSPLIFDTTLKYFQNGVPRESITLKHIESIIEKAAQETENQLEVKETTETNNSASYLDIMLSYDTDGHMNTSLYDKRDDVNFSITNFPLLISNIPSSPAYGVFISQLIRYARASTKYTDFVLRARRLADKLLSQGYVCDRLTSSLRKFYGRYGELVIHYDVPLSRMVNDILS